MSNDFSVAPDVLKQLKRNSQDRPEVWETQRALRKMGDTMVAVRGQMGGHWEDTISLTIHIAPDDYADPDQGYLWTYHPANTYY